MDIQSLATLKKVDLFSEVIEDLSIRFSPRFLGYKPTHNIEVETKNYILRSASSMGELLEVFRLRYQNFLENIKGSDETYDLDEFDHLCDHLIVKCKRTGDIIGTYRILCSLYTDKFYSQGEFQLGDFFRPKRIALELGRACIESNHRNGNVIDLLWRGIGQYSIQTSAELLFGCSSIKTTNPSTILAVHELLKEKGHCENLYNIRPTAPHDTPFSQFKPSMAIELKDHLPPLLRSYLSAGAKIQGMPAIDNEFGCYDFFTALDLKIITPSYQRRYFRL